jgi:lysophospholipase L1-like esterase
MTSILFYGDSNTWGYDPLEGRYSSSVRWPEVLKELLPDWQIQENGQPGRTAEDPVLINSRTDLFAVMLGTNDILRGADAEQTASHMAVFLDTCGFQKNQILLMVPPAMKVSFRGNFQPREKEVRESLLLPEAYQKLAEKKNVQLINTQSWSLEISFDGVHLSGRGHITLASRLAKELKKGRSEPPWAEL